MRKKISDYKIADVLGEDVISENLRLLRQIHKYINEGQTALVIGAGMSVPAGLPTWNALIAKCFGILFALQEKTLSGQERSLDVSVSTVGDMQLLPDRMSITVKPYDSTLHRLQSEELFPESYQAIINQLEEGNGQIGAKTNLLELGEYLRIDTAAASSLAAQTISENLVTELVRRCTTTKKTIDEIKETALGKLTYLLKDVSTAGIEEVVTYNFDTLFEACLNALGKAEQYEVYSSETAGIEKVKPVQIYHVHGIAPTASFDAGLKPTPLIFTEDSYYSEEKDTLSWPLRLQNDLMLRKSCLLFGFSGLDYNFRRIVKIQKAHLQANNNPHIHYLFLPIQDVLPEIDGLLDDTMDSAQLEICERLIMNFLCSQKAKYWESYGFRIIWTSYVELESMIDFLAGKIQEDRLKNILRECPV